MSPVGGAAGAADRNSLLLTSAALLDQGGGVHRLQANEFAAAGNDHLAHVLQPPFQLGQHLFGITVGALLDRGGLLARATDQGLTLLLGLLTELQCISLQTLGFRLAALLQTHRLLTDLLQFSQALLPGLLVLLGQLPFQLDGFLIQLLTALQRFLFQLLAALAELLLHLSHARLVVLLRLGQLLAGLHQQLFTLLSPLLPQFSALSLCLLSDRLAVDQLFTLLAGLVQHFIRLLARLTDELLLLGYQLFGLGQLRGQCFPHCIHQLDRVLLIHQATTAEGHARAVQDDLLQLIELVEHGRELCLSHGKRSRT